MSKLKIPQTVILALLFLFYCKEAAAQYDSVAIAILDSMSSRIYEHESCSFTFESEYDKFDDFYGLITHGEYGKVVMKAPSKMYVEKKGDKGHKEFYSDGISFHIYSHDRNQYASLPATMTLIEFIDSISSYYAVEFPGVDVFYPDFVDNILENSDNLIYLGFGLVNDTQCFHIAGVMDDLTFQIWITSDGNYIPKKLSLVYITRTGNPRYSITYSDWKYDEVSDESIFTFKFPAGATQTKIAKGVN